MTAVSVAIAYTICAGIMNGSFALPSKYAKNWRFENLWLNYAVWAFFILPWVSIFILEPNIWRIYAMIPSYTLFILIVGGFLFGIGQICFALAMRTIGIGLGFVINIGLGTGLGFLFPLVFLHPEAIWTSFGLVTLIGIIFIIGGLLLSYYAGHQRDLSKKFNPETLAAKSSYKLGVLFAIIAGIGSAGQNFTFALTSNMQQLALVAGVKMLAAAIVIWPAFLTCAFIPYGVYMLYLHGKNTSFNAYKTPNSARNYGFAVIMAILWFGSLIAYSQAALWIGSTGPIVAWPLFMVFIILTSNFWGWKSKEWAGCSADIKRHVFLAMVLLVVAVVILAYSAVLTP